jgi:8-oxo-dGTP diphosphatase
MSLSATVIGIAVVEHENCFLVGVREVDGPLPGYAEFPGGKCEPNESPADCACRECWEETGLSVVAVCCLLNRVFDYAHGRVDLHFWHCRPNNRPVLADEYQGFRWIPRDELTNLQFPEANAPLIERLFRQRTE